VYDSAYFANVELKKREITENRKKKTRERWKEGGNCEIGPKERIK